MIQETIKKYKTPLIISGVLILGYAGYKYYKKKNPSTPDALNKDEKDFAGKGQRLTYTLASYTSLADAIYNAWFQNSNIFNSVDEKKILSVFAKMKNDLDVIQLIRAFGKRRAPILFISVLTEKVTLPEWLNIGLSTKEIQALNDILNNNNIVFQL